MSGDGEERDGVALPPEVVRRAAALAARHGLDASQRGQLSVLLERLVFDARAPTGIRDPQAVIDRHLADSLVALELERVRGADALLDLGAGAGLPGLALAIVLPRSRFVLLDSAARKVAFMRDVVSGCRLANVEVVHERAETLATRTGPAFDVVTARAVARLDVTAEYAAPLLRVGGSLVAWAGRRAREAEDALDRAAAELGLRRIAVRRVEPFPDAEHRHLYVMLKVSDTPARFPRRPGVAHKRPLGANPRRSAGV